MFEVVNGLIICNNRVLLTQRRPEKDFPWTWKVPGGHVGQGESHHQALTRELKEELGVGLNGICEDPDYTIRQASVSRPGEEVLILFYRVKLVGTPYAREGQGIGWFNPTEVRKLTLCGGLKATVENLVDLMSLLTVIPTITPKNYCVPSD